MKYLVCERYADNGGFSHYELINTEDGSTVIEDIDQALQLLQPDVISSVFRPEWLTYDIRVKVKDLWDLPNVNNSNPRTSAIKLIREIAKHNGYEIDLKKAVEIVKEHCL